MGDTVWVGLLSLIGTCVGSLAGILTANKLVNYRLRMLENKVNRHNQLTEKISKKEFLKFILRNHCFGCIMDVRAATAAGGLFLNLENSINGIVLGS